ncbi:MAG: FeoB small GTPase domain-containing protein, partial [Myxococcota bacterium]
MSVEAATAAVTFPELHLALVGSPNSGKTTLFNALTGARAKVGNFPGVTVERRVGHVRKLDRPVRLLDLPGTYSLEPETPDEAIVLQVLRGERPEEPVPDALAVVVDGTTLERSLGLVVQTLHLGLPLVVVVTMMDELIARGARIDLDRLARILGVPVVGVVGHRGVGLDQLRS